MLFLYVLGVCNFLEAADRRFHQNVSIENTKPLKICRKITFVISQIVAIILINFVSLIIAFEADVIDNLFRIEPNHLWFPLFLEILKLFRIVRSNLIIITDIVILRFYKSWFSIAL